MNNIKFVILAAGKGTRMQSKRPKVLHKLAGISLIEHLVHTIEAYTTHPPVVICGYQKEQLQQSLANRNIVWVEQKQQLGTAHAVQQALPHINDEDVVITLCGDVPLVSQDLIQQLVDHQHLSQQSISLVSSILSDPTGYGRIIKNAANVTAIVEEKDANKNEKSIKECNMGIYAIPALLLKKYLPKINNNNSQKEFYLTEIVALSAKDGIAVKAMLSQDLWQTQGINSAEQLARLERQYQRNKADALMAAGVRFIDPNRFDLRGNFSHGEDVDIDINVILEGEVSFGSNVKVGPNVFIKNAVIGDNVCIEAMSHIEGAKIANNASIGPFARIRPGSLLADGAKIGNFVEIKKTKLGQGSKVNHLSYVGDANVGDDVNIGAGTITCNYDGQNKHETIIEEGAFIGSNTALIAPITIGEKATIGAGSTLSKDAPANSLTVTRSKQLSVSQWKRPKKKEK